MNDLRLNPDADISVLRLGNEQQPLIMVENLLLNPQVLVDFAQQSAVFSRDPGNFYPGIRATLAGNYADLSAQLLSQVVSENLNPAGQVQVDTKLCALSITNQQPATLLPIQRIPHFDSCDNQQWALVHYLCDAECGGTGFFRHRQTGYESISADRNKRYQRILGDEAITKGLPAVKYLTGESELFEQTYAVEASFNRALLYPSNLLHSGLIKHWQSDEIGQCRLTANCFLHLSNC